MSEGRIWFMLDLLWLLALAGVCFGYLGWWWRGKLAVTMSLPEDLQEISELKERLLEYEIASKQDGYTDDSEAPPSPTGGTGEPANDSTELHHQISELTTALAAAQEAERQALKRAAKLDPLEAELAASREALALAEQQKESLNAELELAKQALASAPAEAQGVLPLDLPDAGNPASSKKQRSGKKK